jgi:hypothetical protein
MKRLVLLLLFAVAAWYGWKHYPEILHRGGSHEAVIENASGREMARVRLTVGARTYVKDSIPDGGKAVIPFRVADDASFTLVWIHDEGSGEHTWSGGNVPRGPMLQRHIMTVDGDDSVLYRAENK